MFICRFGEARDSLISEFAKKYLIGKKILEIGCEEGDRTKLFYTVSNQVIGLDIVDTVKNEHKKQFSFLLADARKLPFASGTFDAVVSFDAIEHIDDDKDVFTERCSVYVKKEAFCFLVLLID